MVDGEWDITPLFQILQYYKRKSHFSEDSSRYLISHSLRSIPKKFFIGYDVTTWLDPKDFAIFNYMLYFPDSNPTDYDNTRDLEVRYKPLDDIKDWSQIRGLLWEVKGETCHITAQHSILNGLGLGHYGFIETDLVKDFLQVSKDCSVGEARREIEPTVIERMCSQIDAKKSTIGLVVDDALLRNKEFAKRAPDILELRQKELEGFSIPVIFDRIFWDALYFTAIGYQILRLSGGRRTKDKQQQQLILDAFNEVGFKIEQIELSSLSDVEEQIRNQLDQLPVSPNIRNYIRMLPECRLGPM
jgi:hypothetical protein